MSRIKAHTPASNNHHSNKHQSFVQQTALTAGQKSAGKDNQTESDTTSDIQSQVQLNPSPFGVPFRGEPFVPSTVFGQPKLNIGKPNDKYEVEADRVADKVVEKSITEAPKASDTPPPVQTKDSGGAEEGEGVKEEVDLQAQEIDSKSNQKESDQSQIQEKPISESITTGVQLKPIAQTDESEVQKKEEDTEGESEVQAKLDASTDTSEKIQKVAATDEESNDLQKKNESSAGGGNDVESSLKSSKGKGSAMDDNTRSSMESGFGADFSGVRIHTDSNAVQMNKSLGSQAFANGSDVYFNEGKYNPSSKDGQHLLAHELTHTVQQGASGKGIQKQDESESDVGMKPHTSSEKKNVQKQDESQEEKIVQHKSDATIQKEDSENKEGDNKKTETNPHAPTSDPFFVPFDRSKERSESEFKQENKSAIQQQLQKETGQAASEVPVEADPTLGKPTALNATDKNKKETVGEPLVNKEEVQPEAPEAENTKEKQKESEDKEKKQDQGQSEQAKEKEQAPETIKEAPPATQLPQIEPDPGVAAIEQLNEVEPSSSDIAAVASDQRTPKEKFEEQASIAAQFTQAHETGKANLQQKINNEKGVITQREATLSEVIHSRHAQQVAQIRLTITNQKSQLTAAFEQTRLTMEANKSGEFARLEEVRLSKIELLKTELSTRRDAFNTFVDEQTEMPKKNARNEADRADSELELAAKEAISQGEGVARKHQGGDDGNPEARESVREIAAETAADIKNSKSVIRKDLMKTALEFNGGFETYRNDIVKQTKSTEEELTKTINEATESFKSIITDTYAKITTSLNEKEQDDLQKLTNLEESQIQAANKNKDTGLQVVNDIAEKSRNEIDVKGAYSIEMLDTLGNNVAQLLSADEGTPNLPAMREFAQSNIARLQEIEAEGVQLIDTIRNKADVVFAKTNQSNQTANTEIDEDTTTKSTELVTRSATQRDEIMAQLAAMMQESFTSLETALDQMRDEALSAIDEAIEERKGKIHQANSEFLDKLIEQNDEGIKTAKQPLTDPLISRLWSAADRATASWWEGLLAAIGDFILMLIIIVAVAALLVAFGVFSTITGALLVIGLVLLAGMFLFSLGKRLYDGHGWSSIPLAFADTLGITMIYQGVTNTDIATGQNLGMNPFDRWYSGTTGTLQFITILSPFKSKIPGIRSIRLPKILSNNVVTRGLSNFAEGGMKWIEGIGQGTRIRRGGGVEQPSYMEQFGNWMASKFTRGNQNNNSGQNSNSNNNQNNTGQNQNNNSGQNSNSNNNQNSNQNQNNSNQNNQNNTGQNQNNNSGQNSNRNNNQNNNQNSNQNQNNNNQSQNNTPPVRTIQSGDVITIDNPSRLTYSQPKIASDGYVKWVLYDQQTGAVFTHYVKAKGTLGPDMFLDPLNSHVMVNGQKVPVELEAVGFKWTEIANRLNMEAYEAYFGGRPPNLNGQIWASNLTRFIVKYAEVRARMPQGTSRQVIADAAIRETSFGRGKIAEGYDNLKVDLTSTQFENVIIKDQNGVPQQYKDVPSDQFAIDVEALP